ncbi:MAG: metallo-beta-lactamase family protein [Rickettsiaceae bacterium]|jgi:hydroxyacylglutathione hydrolase|nr:metallo-beta-lactamase family protein [Rickettsiaceae bacterium]
MEIVQLPVLKDNYVYILTGGRKVCVIDPSIAAPVLQHLMDNNLKLDYIINTHHHWDHTDGNAEIKAATGCKVIGYKGDAHRIPGIDIEVEDGQEIEICGEIAKVMFIPGHTLGHVAYYFEKPGIVFCGDTLFSLGCGRLFEGTAKQMHNSLQKLVMLPKDTKVYCAHEYTESNAKFALSIEPDNQALLQRVAEVKALRQQSESTVPSTIALELATNPFLRVNNLEKFAKLRKAKDIFK